MSEYIQVKRDGGLEDLQNDMSDMIVWIPISSIDKGLSHCHPITPVPEYGEVPSIVYS